MSRLFLFKGERAAVADEQRTFETAKAMEAEGVSPKAGLNRAIGAYTELISLPKEILPEANLKALQNAYRACEAYSTPENAAALMREVRAGIRVASQMMGAGATVDASVAGTVSRLEAAQGYIDRLTLLGGIGKDSNNVVKLNQNLGGAYKDVPANGGQVHHMPADSASPYSNIEDQQYGWIPEIIWTPLVGEVQRKRGLIEQTRFNKESS